VEVGFQCTAVNGKEGEGKTTFSPCSQVLILRGDGVSGGKWGESFYSFFQ
jgi:hypothetical protein